MARTFLRATKAAMLSGVVLAASSLVSLPASAQATDEKDYMGELAILLLTPKGSRTNGAAEPSTNRQFNRLIVKKLDKVRKAR